MITRTEGYQYELENFEDSAKAGQVIQFIQRGPKPDDSTEVDLLKSQEKITISDGTTNEEVLAMLIDRLNYLQGKFPCRENAIVITKLEESLMWLNKRTQDRVNRGVEGKNIK